MKKTIKCFLSAFLLLGINVASSQSGTIRVKKNPCECAGRDSVSSSYQLQGSRTDTAALLLIKGNALFSRSDEPVPGARLFLRNKDVNLQSITGPNGDFFFNNVKPGKYVLHVSYPCHYPAVNIISHVNRAFIQHTVYLDSCNASPRIILDKRSKN